MSGILTVFAMYVMKCLIIGMHILMSFVLIHYGVKRLLSIKNLI